MTTFTSSLSGATVTEVAELFDAMAPTYDEITDLWYTHLMARIEESLLDHLKPGPSSSQKSALDIGCGTGIQTYILNKMGYRSIGVDISPDLLDVARRKLPESTFVLGNAQQLPFDTGQFDVVNCCGSTLSFVPDHVAAIQELARILVDGGRFVIEVEQRWNFDLFWGLFDSIFFNRLNYDLTFREALSQITYPPSQGFFIDYPFHMDDGSLRNMRIRLFTKAELVTVLKSCGLIIEQFTGVHIATNLIPSTILHETHYKNWFKRPFEVLAKIDSRIMHRFPFHSLGCSLIVKGYKMPLSLGHPDQ